MNPYITGGTIRTLREKQKMTQEKLAAALCVSAKTVSKWETGRGYPDITLLEQLASALKVSLTELLTGCVVENSNRSANMLRARIYVCPVCGNILHSMGAAAVSCCGITLPPLEAEPFDDDHRPVFEPVEDETFVTVKHEMTRQHYISFMAWMTGDRLELIKLYP